MPDLDLFAGAGGWDVAARKLGRNPLGIECDASACLTRDAADHATLNADIAALDPSGFAPCDLLIASPPCQSYSRAGKGEGRKDVRHVVECSRELAQGDDTRALHLERCADARSLLVVEPLRWALALMPRVVVCEQVPDVLPYWRLVGELLAEHGYSWWAGVLEAERYGVPQTRERAILIARRDGIPAHPPEPTHRRYVKGEANGHEDSLFGDGLLPWVSMAQALGWGGDAVRMTEETPRENEAERTMVDPAPTVSGKGGHGRRVWVQRERSGDRAEEGFNASEMSCQSLTSKARPWTVEHPAPTVVGSRRSKDGMLVGRQLPEGEGENVGGWGWNPRQNGGTVRDGAEPAPTVLAEGLAKGVPVWDDTPHECPKAGGNAVRVTVQEAAILQTFPPDYPWQGSRTAQFQQIGNAVPPMLAEAILRTVA